MSKQNKIDLLIAEGEYSLIMATCKKHDFFIGS